MAIGYGLVAALFFGWGLYLKRLPDQAPFGMKSEFVIHRATAERIERLNYPIELIELIAKPTEPPDQDSQDSSDQDERPGQIDRSRAHNKEHHRRKSANQNQHPPGACFTAAIAGQAIQAEMKTSPTFASNSEAAAEPLGRSEGSIFKTRDATTKSEPTKSIPHRKITTEASCSGVGVFGD